MVLSGKVSVFVEKRVSLAKHRGHERKRGSLMLTLSPAPLPATRKMSASKGPANNPFAQDGASTSTAANAAKPDRKLSASSSTRRRSSTTKKRVGFADEEEPTGVASTAPPDDKTLKEKEAPRKTSLLRELSARKESTGDGKDEGPLDPRKEQVIVERHELGSFITSLGMWALFGEMALLNWDRVRRAHVVADGKVALIRVTQELFDLALATVVREVYQAKRFFINSSPVFSRWLPDAKEQLMLVLEREVLPFDRRVQRQGDRATHLYFIVKCAHVPFSTLASERS